MPVAIESSGQNGKMGATPRYYAIAENCTTFGERSTRGHSYDAEVSTCLYRKSYQYRTALFTRKRIFINAAAVKPNCCTGGASVKLSVSDPSMVTITVSATLNRIHQLTDQLNT